MKFKLSAASLSGKLDKAKGTIRDLSIISEGPALGHGVAIDGKTLSNVYELTKGAPVKAYWTHGDMFTPDRLGQEVGLFAAPYIDTGSKQLKAQFTVFDAFKTTYPERYAYLFELAEKAPSEFGLSIAFEGDAFWVLDSGAEVAANGDKPANAVGDMPVVRVYKINSADFVSQPAANAGGLFTQVKLTELLDIKQKLSAELTDLATKLTVNGDELKAKDTVYAELKAKFETANKALETDKAAFAAKETEFTAQKTALEATNKELAANVAKLSADIEGAKTDAATKAAEYKAQMEAMNKALLEFGAVPVNIYMGEPVDHRATLAAIKDPAEKTRYWLKHKAAILAG